MTLPYRFAEKSVFRYLSVIHKIQDNPPTRLEFNPTPLGVNSETAACRLRDAINSLCSGKTTHPSINPTLLAERFRLYRVTHDGTKVFVVPKTEKKTSSAASLQVDQHDPSDVLAVLESTDYVAIGAFALLLGRQLLQGRVEIRGSLPASFCDELMKQHDISITIINPNLAIMV